MRLSSILKRVVSNTLLSAPDEPKPSLSDLFALQSGQLRTQPVHIVHEDVLRELANLHPYNADLFKPDGRRRDFLELLFIGPQGGTFFIISDEERRFIGSLTLRPMLDKPHCIELSQISVHKNYRNMGLATKLLESMKTHLNEDRPDIGHIVINSFEEDGDRWLRPLIFKMASGFKARIHERDTWTFELMPLRQSAPK